MVKNHLRRATSEIRKSTWYDVSAARNASGLTIKDWCRKDGINETSYYYWRKKIRTEALEMHIPEKGDNFTFVPMLKARLVDEMFDHEKELNAGCWSHARRRFAEVVKTHWVEKSKGTLAYEALRQIAAIHKLDNALDKLNFEDRKRQRRLTAKPLVEAYFAWIKAHINETPLKNETK